MYRTTFRAAAATLLAASAPILYTPAVLAAAANYGASVIQYTPGTGAAPGYDQSSAVLGEPSRITPGDFGGPVDPFSSPWQSSQLLSVGAGGSVTLRFEHPVLNQPGNPFGLDFLVFGSAAFLIVNGDYTGGGVTDGSLFGLADGANRVSVSADGVAFLTLDPARAPQVDRLYPTDGAGDFSQPVNPALTEAAFAGLGLAGIRNLYAGSGGGIGYDLDWARDAGGQSVKLDSIQFVRIDVLSGRAEIDAVSAVPEPSTGLLAILGAGALRSFRPRLRRADRSRTSAGRLTSNRPFRRMCAALAAGVLPLLAVLPGAVSAASFREDFSSDPAKRGWTVRGDPSLFRWNAEDGRLQVTWDSTAPNSFFLLPLPTTITRTDNVRMTFTLFLDEIRTSSPDATFQLAIGFLRQLDATSTNFFRGAGIDPAWGPRNLLEFDYFPASRSITPTFSAVAVGTNNLRWAMVNQFPYELTPGATYQIDLEYTAATQTLFLIVDRDDSLLCSGSLRLNEPFGDFRLDAFSITSYSGDHQPDGYGGGLFARGWVDDIRIEYPDSSPPPAPPRLEFAPATQARGPLFFTKAVSGWVPQWHRRQGEGPWETITSALPTGTNVWTLLDPAPPADSAYYRLLLDRP